MRLALAIVWSALAPVALSSCLVTNVDPTPNRNSPPRILLSGERNSATTPTDRVFLVAQTAMPGRETFVTIALDIEDSDSSNLEYRTSIIGPTSAGSDGGVGDDAGVSLTGFTRTIVTSGSGAVPVEKGKAHLLGFIIAGANFVPTGRCYGIEVSVSSDFANAGTSLTATPVTEGDVDRIIYWVASYGPTDTAIDLATCPLQP